MVEPSPSVESYYAYEDTVGLDHLSKLEPLDSLVEPSYEELEAYIRSTDYYANIDAINPNVQVMTMDEDTIFIHFNSNNDQGFMITSSEYGYIIQRSYHNTKRFTYTKDGQTREAEMHITNRRNYHEGSYVPNEYFISLVVPNSDNDVNYRLYYDLNEQEFHEQNEQGIIDQELSFTSDLQQKMINTMKYFIPIFDSYDQQGMAFIENLFFDYYQVPYLISAAHDGYPYDQRLWINRRDNDYETLAGLSQLWVPYFDGDRATSHVFVNETELNGQTILTAVNALCINGSIDYPYEVSITTYHSGQSVEDAAFNESDFVDFINEWFDHYIENTIVNPQQIESTQQTISAYKQNGIIGSFGFFDHHVIFTTFSKSSDRADLLVMIPTD